ncbi:MAG: rod shape-determining protein MreC [Bacteroidetes bacterium GWE2_29_8]|nr:MAG: rod shape-determining protein MreC [Bacteroidetes bacterium GWE2_29_8]OFY22841.1 MAG: rod shape-determining protein MreC [Bacteroidetes bacterium GWF2_29_10]
MRNIIIFFQRYYVTILFVLYLIIGFVFLFQYNNYQKVYFFNRFTSFSGNIYIIRDRVYKHFSLDQANRELIKENALLKEKLKDSYIINQHKTFEINDSLYKQRYEYTTAKIIYSTVNSLKNYLILDKGAKDGITENMAVVNNKGIVGIVNNVSDNFSTVLSVLNNKVKVSIKLERTKYIGTLIWDGYNSNKAKIIEIPIHAEIKVGDKVITSGYSEIFPENYSVGYILHINRKPGNNFYDIDIMLSNDFNNINYVYIVKCLYKKEIEKLKEKIGDDK